MRIGVIGVCEDNCPLHLREQLAKAFLKLYEKVRLEGSYVLLSTCRRVELYFSSHDLTKTHVEILEELRLHMQESFEQALFSLFESECLLHLMRVTAGLESSILGESEIQKQVKLSYESARETSKLSPEIHYSFQKSLKQGKNLRASFEFFKRQDSLAHVILTQMKLLSQKTFTNQKVLFIGNSQINRRILPVFFAKQFKQITLATKNVDVNLHKFQKNFQVQSYQVLDKLNSFDVVISATSVNSYLIDKSFINSQDMVLFDLSVPRSICPKVKNIATLMNIEELGALFQKKRKLIHRELSLCETILLKQVCRYKTIFKEKNENKKKLSLLNTG